VVVFPLRAFVFDGRSIFFVLTVNNYKMEHDKATPRIIEALRLRDGVAITFEDGKCAVYTAALLYAIFPTPTN